MKSRLLFITGFLFLCSTVTVKAQDNTIKFENVVNEQFGTLLESLLKDGKIDETSAKTYLETVFGFDAAANNYIQAQNLTQTLSNLSQNNLSLGDFSKLLNSNLLSLIPTSYQQQLMQNPSYLGWQLGEELRNGGLSSSSIQNLMDMFEKGMEESARKKQIIGKLQQITPTLYRLSKQNTANAKKFKITETFDNAENVNELNNPRHLTNIVMVKNGTLTLSQDWSYFQSGGSGMLAMQNENHSWIDKTDRRIYKNLQKFDFSKDFTAIFHLKFLTPTLDKKGKYFATNRLKINIGKGYVVYLENDWKGNFMLSSPSNYEVTENYGNLKESKGNIKSEKKKITDKIVYEKNSKKQSIDFSTELKPHTPIKLTITKVGDVFTASIDGFDVILENKIDYYPDKYYLGFLQTNLQSNGAGSFNDSRVEIDTIELGHL